METAPRDGRPFVAGLWVGEATTARFVMHIIRADPHGHGVHPEDDQGWAWSDYTHWSPLPATPERSSQLGRRVRSALASAPMAHQPARPR